MQGRGWQMRGGVRNMLMGGCWRPYTEQGVGVGVGVGVAAFRMSHHEHLVSPVLDIASPSPCVDGVVPGRGRPEQVG